MDLRSAQLRLVEPAERAQRLESRKNIEDWLRERSAVLEALLREEASAQRRPRAA